jgi:hypothetical protein
MNEFLIHKFFLNGNVEKSRQRRSLPSPKRFAQAGRHFAVLTYAITLRASNTNESPFGMN